MKLHTTKFNKTQRKAILQHLMDDPRVKPLTYDMQTHFDLGDFVIHPSYGHGYVERLIDQDKIQVFFNINNKAEAKVLLHKC